MKVIIAEKPSVAKNIADALNIKGKKDGYYEGSNYIITWAFGHLLQLYDAKDYDAKMGKWNMNYFPFIPSQFQYKVKSNPRQKGKEDLGAKKQLKIIYGLMKRPDVNGIISACDYDREGQIIGDTIIYNTKINKTVYRLLLNEWTKEEVLKGLQSIRPNSEMASLRDAGIGRQWADWVIGINLTSVATLKYQKGSGKVLNIGRVLLPTLKIIYDRDKEIEQFTPEDYFKLVATFETESGQKYEGIYTIDNKDKFPKMEELQQIVSFINEKQATIMEKKVERKREFPPYLFNLSNLQGYITSKYKGWTSEKVLKVAQSLYEKKYITYPRTASVVLEESLVGKVANVVEKLKKGLPYENEIKFKVTKRNFDNSKVESHSAIVPTYVIPKSLSNDEQIVYTAIKNRLLMQFMPVAEYEETKLITKVKNEDVQGHFLSKGKVQLVEGWKKVEKQDTKDIFLPNVNEQEIVQVVDQNVTSHVTKPPNHHTEKTLLRIMETCGKRVKEDDSEEMMSTILSGYSIGTPATRAETIKKLKDAGYITTQNKSLICTELGKKLVETFPVKELFDLQFTGRLEKALFEIEKGNFQKEKFLQFIYQFTKKAIEKVKLDKDIIIQEATREKKSTEILGKCPACGGSVQESYKGFGCTNWKNGCKFVIWKNDKFLATMKKKPTKTMVKSILASGKATVKGFTSKNGNKFDCILLYEKNNQNDYYSWKMEFPTKKEATSTSK
ncbi:DNA topoisomerase [Sutcliffiella cohnii]|uniref:type IA DNA topoisomerase n=1 Tax=Sutcliffiella cohnii TaxID=33932 RepID=UPI002E236404|nr:DNA topoisomerase [Sutcliffiella cohnii]MED4014727.1 DNA topoisomerase [Sutcliffiella cohnii]